MPARMPLATAAANAKAMVRPSRLIWSKTQDVALDFRGHAGANEVQAPACDQQAEQGAAHGEDNAFGDQLRDEPPASGAHGGADGQFTDAPGSARELQVGATLTQAISSTNSTA